MKILIVVHPNMALTDNWTNEYDKGISYYNDVLAARANYDVVLCPFLLPFSGVWKTEHDNFVEEASCLFDVAKFELHIGEVILAHLDTLFLEKPITQIDFAGGYATDCLATTLKVFLDAYATYCQDAGITVRLRSDLIYDAWSHARLSEAPTTASLKELLWVSHVSHRSDYLSLLGLNPVL
jgi:hypothetical protein